MCACMYVCVHICICVCMYMYMYVYMYIEGINQNANENANICYIVQFKNHILSITSWIQGGYTATGHYSGQIGTSLYIYL